MVNFRMTIFLNSFGIIYYYFVKQETLPLLSILLWLYWLTRAI